MWESPRPPRRRGLSKVLLWSNSNHTGKCNRGSEPAYKNKGNWTCALSESAFRAGFLKTCHGEVARPPIFPLKRLTHTLERNKGGPALVLQSPSTTGRLDLREQRESKSMCRDLKNSPGSELACTNKGHRKCALEESGFRAGFQNELPSVGISPPTRAVS